MHNRWFVLAVLFTVRLTMAFQFQSVAAVAPLLGHAFGVSLADIGILIGLYFAPGVALALPGGAIGQRFGDKRTVVAALLLMLIGGLAMALSSSWSVQIALIIPWPRTSGPDGEPRTRLIRAACISCPTAAGWTSTQMW